MTSAHIRRVVGVLKSLCPTDGPSLDSYQNVVEGEGNSCSPTVDVYSPFTKRAVCTTIGTTKNTFAASRRTVVADEVLLPASVRLAFKIRATYMLARMIAFPQR